MTSPHRMRDVPGIDRIAVVGGGRWARVLTGVLCDLVPARLRISVHSPRNAPAMSAWASTRGLGERIDVHDRWPLRDFPGSTAVIIANAARDHEAAAASALGAGHPVLVEKPVALTSGGARRLAQLARERNGVLASAQVFRFTRYVDRMAKRVGRYGALQSIRVEWTDTATEERYGELKRFDPGLPVFLDLLPHVLSIVSVLLPDAHGRCERLEFLRGGAHVELQLMLDSVPCDVLLARNADRRRRVVETSASGGAVRLDFSEEPGTITAGTTRDSGDPDWDTKERPLSSMLRAFLRWAGTGEFDPRLDFAHAVQFAGVVEEVAGMYNSARLSWLAGRLAGSLDSDLRYSLGEILQAEGALSKATLDSEMESVRARFSADEDRQVLKTWVEERLTLNVER